MVGWYDPRVLMHSAYQIAIANIFGRHSDTRLIEALASQPQTEFDYSQQRAISGSTTSRTSATAGIPRTRSRTRSRGPTLEVEHGGRRETTRAGRVLVFGGDEVYPYPSRNEYEVRTEIAVHAARSPGRPRPDVFAIPGNHDWYDSLVAFSRTFCRPERGFAGCQTRQTRSYFALRAARQLVAARPSTCSSAPISTSRRCSISRTSRRSMDDDARLIFCVPEPRWILEDAYPRHANYEELSGTRFLEEKVFKRKARVFLTGDLHFYKRHENAEGVQKITSGGGGAFLHPTHAPEDPRACAMASCSAPCIPTRKPRGAWRGAISCFRC